LELEYGSWPPLGSSSTNGRGGRPFELVESLSHPAPGELVEELVGRRLDTPLPG